MNAPNMILHIVDPTENLTTSIPLTENTRVVLRLVTSTILLTAESIMRGLRTILMSTEEILPVTIEMFSQITAPLERRLRRAAWVGAAPGPITRQNTKVA